MNLKHFILILSSALYLFLAGCEKEPLETTGGLRHKTEAESTGETPHGTFSPIDLNPAPAVSKLMVHNIVSHFWAALVRGDHQTASGCVSGNAAQALQELLTAYDPAGSLIRASGLTLSDEMRARADSHTETLLRACFRNCRIESLQELSPAQYTVAASVTCIDMASFLTACGNVTYEDLLLVHAQEAARIAATQGEAYAYEYLVTVLIDHLEAQLTGQLGTLPLTEYTATMHVSLVDGKWLITELQLLYG